MNTQIILSTLGSIIKTDSDRISTADLFAMVEDKLSPELDLAEFRSVVSEALNGSKYHSVRGRCGGIRLRGEEKETIEEKDPDEPETEYVSIYITNTLRIHPVDNRNWAIQTKVSNVWFSRAYWPSLGEALMRCGRKLLDGDLKGGKNIALKLEEVATIVQASEKRVCKLLEDVVVSRPANEAA